MDGFAYNIVGALCCLVVVILQIVRLIKTRDIRILSTIGLFLFGGILFVAYTNFILEGVMAFATIACLVVSLIVYRHKDGSDGNDEGK